MMQAAVKSVREAAAKLGRPAPKLIAVTILTSMDDEQFGDLNYKNTIAEQVIALAKLALAWMVSLPRHRKLQVFEVPVVPSF